jgi:hypothetical protein
MEKHDRPDLFDVKYLRDELLYYARDENQFLRRRRTFVFALWPDLATARVKDADLPFQRIILLLSWLVVAVRRLTDWLSTDALTILFAFVDDQEPEALAAERALMQMVLRELLENGTVAVERLPGVQPLRHECAERARRSLCHCLTLATQDRAIEVEHVDVRRLQLAGPVPVLVGAEPGTAQSAAGLDPWAAALQELLEAWV